MDLNKICTKCNIEKELNCFSKRGRGGQLRSDCKECQNLYNRVKYLENVEKYKKTRLNWRKKNKKHLINYSNNYFKNRKKNDKLFKLKCNLRSLIWHSFNTNGYSKKSKLINILGCDFDFFKGYIEAQFTKNMDWNNIHLDHIKPISYANSEKEIIELNHYTNFQPLLSTDNLKKSNKLIKKQLRLL